MKRTQPLFLVLALFALLLGADRSVRAQTADLFFSEYVEGSVTPVVINEFVFNHTGLDTNEFVEVAGAANMDYSALTIVEIEGDGAGAGVIDAATAVGTTDGAGYWTTGFQDNVYENGTVTVLLVEGFSGSVGDDLDVDDDGVLDVTPWTQVVDGVAVSDGGSGDQAYAVTLAPGYDGISFTVGGASRIPDRTDTNSAVDWTRNDFDGAGLPGFTGSLDAGEALNTPGAMNELVPAPVAEVVINEIMQNPAAVDDSAGEWFELYNAGTGEVDINGWTIADNGIDSHVIDNGGPLVIPVGGYLVLGKNTDSGTNGGVTVDYGYGSNWFLANGADEVVLLDGSGNEVDRVEYDGGPVFPDPTGASMSLRDPALDNNVGENWCTSVTPYGAGDLGTPGRKNSCEVLPNLVINEIMQNPAAVYDSAGEWFELYNADDSGVDINGWTIADNDSDSHVIDNGGPLVIAAGGYLVLGNNADSATNGGVTVDYSYGSGWSLANGADEVVLLDGSGNEVDRVEYDGGPIFPDPNGASMALRDPALDNNAGENWCTSVTSYGAGDLGTPGAANDCPPPPPPNVCGEPATLIHAIQGDGATSPLAGQAVTIEGVVVGDFQQGDNVTDVYDTDLGGFYVQEEDADADSNPATSEGIFVFDRSAPDVAVGDHVRVSGVVTEFTTPGGSSLTEVGNVSNVQLCEAPAAMPAVTEITLPVANPRDFEQYEGMWVRFPQELVIAEYFNFDRFNEIVLAEPLDVADRLFQPTSYLDPGPETDEIIAALDLIARSRITLDDGRTTQNPDPAIHPNGQVFSTGDSPNRFRGGDIVQNATGVIDESFGLYRIQPTQGADYTAANPRPAAPEETGGNLHVASFNVLNYFLTIDHGSDICGPDQDQECRGADSTTEFERQRAKIISALTAIEADVYGLIEMENTTGVKPLEDIVNGLNEELGAGTYAYIDTGTIGTDAIKVGLIYKPASVTPVGDYAILDSSVDSRFDDSKNRPALAQTFQDTETGGIFTVVVNHLKSKGSDCDGPPDDDPLQGNCNGTRTLAAEALVDWLATDPTGSGDADFLITGDLNSYDEEDPIDAILAGADDTLGTADDYVDLVEKSQGEFAYSYVFDGQLGYLDHALATKSLVEETTGTTVWHINADEPDILDYDTSFKRPAEQALYEENPYRSSDHDPVIVGLDVCDEIAPTATVTVDPAVLWPPNHEYVDVTATVLASDNFDPNPTVTLLGVTSDEPDNGPEDGDTVNDIVTVDDFHFKLRAERSGIGDGRVYTIRYAVSDACGNSIVVEATVTVPLAQGE